ncbi:MAG: ADOP family duplicated permease [Terriglobales bacterium]
MARLLRRLLHLLRAGRAAEMAEEIAFHLDAKRAEEGLSAAAAGRGFGNELALRERSREAWGWLWLEQLGQDLRYWGRQARHAPGFFGLAVLILALAIGANTALYSVLNAVLLRPLPYAHADQLMVLDGVGAERSHIGAGGLDVVGTRASWLDQLPAASASAAYLTGPTNVTSAGALPARVVAAEVSPNWFSLLGVALRGAGFAPGDDAAGHSHVIVLSPALALQMGGLQVGQNVGLNRVPYRVVGIAPTGFSFPRQAAAWIPLPNPWRWSGDPLTLRAVYFTPLVRMRPGATAAELRQELLKTDAMPPGWSPTAVTVTPLARSQTERIAPAMWLLLGAVCLVLLIACANVANLQLTRALARRHEFRVRRALGASRGRLVRQQLTESLGLALAAAVAGGALAALTLPALRALVPARVPLNGAITLSPAVLGLALAATLLTVVLTGLPAALEVRTERRDRRRLRSALAVAEVALAMLLLAGAGLLLNSLWRLMRVDPGFGAQGLLTAKFSVSGPNYKSKDDLNRFNDQMLARLQALPGVSAAALGNNLPMNTGSTFMVKVDVPGHSTDSYFTSISPSYFATLQIPLLAGRDFDARDQPHSPEAVIVNRALAAAMWPHQNPVGRRIGTPGLNNKEDYKTVVGEVGDTRLQLDEPAVQNLYFPLAQSPGASALLVRTRADPAALAPSVRQAVAAVDPSIPLSDVATMPALVRADTAEPRFRTLLLGLFALLALGLSVAGLATVMAFTVAQRRQEFGVRMALGAAPGAVARGVLRDTVCLLALGLGLGIAGALASAHLLAHLLYAMSPRDPVTLAAAAAVLTLACLVACWWPARSAARLDPARILRHE